MYVTALAMYAKPSPQSETIVPARPGPTNRDVLKITEEMATSDHVNVGTHVTARNLANDATETFVFLGPWDAEIEDNVMNYRAPLALAFMGKLPCEEVVYGEDEQERRWEIITVEPAN